MQDMVALVSCNLPCLQLRTASQAHGMRKNKTVSMRKVELLCRSKQILPGNFTEIQEKILTSIPRNLLGVAIGLDRSYSSRNKRENRELIQISDKVIAGWTGIAEGMLSRGIFQMNQRGLILFFQIGSLSSLVCHFLRKKYQGS